MSITEKITSYLSAHGPSTARQVASGIFAPKEAVYCALAAAVEAGTIERPSRVIGRYAMPGDPWTAVLGGLTPDHRYIKAMIQSVQYLDAGDETTALALRKAAQPYAPLNVTALDDARKAIRLATGRED